MSFGYSFTKASEVGQLTFGFGATHKTEIRSLSVDGGTITTTKEAERDTQRSFLDLGMRRFRSNRWFTGYKLGFESNDELGLQLRTSLGAGVGRFLVQTSSSELALIGGVVVTNEELAGAVSSQDNVEGMVGVRYAKFHFDDPKVDLTMEFTAYPSFSESGRVRAQFDAKIRRELFHDLFWDITYYNTYDSDSSSGTDATSDYAVVTSLGWTF